MKKNAYSQIPIFLMNKLYPKGATEIIFIKNSHSMLYFDQNMQENTEKIEVMAQRISLPHTFIAIYQLPSDFKSRKMQGNFIVKTKMIYNAIQYTSISNNKTNTCEILQGYATAG